MSFVQDWVDLRRLDFSPLLIGLGLAATGLATWVGGSAWAGTNGLEGFRLGDAWDSDIYFLVGIPLMALAVAVAAYVMPRQPLRWPLCLVAGHQLGVLAGGLGMQSGFSRLILTMALAAMLAAIFAVPALLGSILARRMAERAY